MHQPSQVNRSRAGGRFRPFRRVGLSSISVRRALRTRQSGQAALEASLTAAIAIMTILVTLQLSLVAAQQFSASHVARSTARWLAVRMDTADPDVSAQAAVFATNLPGMSGGGLSSVTVTPSCPSLTSGICTGRSMGDQIKVTVNTSLTAVMFLPTSFGIAPFRFTLPTSMPAISYTVLLE